MKRMVSEKDARSFLKDHRHPAAGALIALSACMLAAPPLIISASPLGWSNWTSWTVRLLGMYAFTLIFMNIVTGALAPYFYVVFKARREYLIHLVTGAAGFLFALAHGVVVLTQRYYRGFSAVWIIGPVTLGLLAVTIWVALDRSRLKKAWRVVHQLNYLVFIAIFVKAIVIGTDLNVASGAQKALITLFSCYVGVAALALAARVRRYKVQARGRRRAAAPSPNLPGGA